MFNWAGVGDMTPLLQRPHGQLRVFGHCGCKAVVKPSVRAGTWLDIMCSQYTNGESFGRLVVIGKVKIATKHNKVDKLILRIL